MRLTSLDELEFQREPGWRIEQILPENAFSLLYAERGVGKSFLALDWLLSMQTGRPWCGREVARAETLFIVGEGVSRLWSRIHAWKTMQQVSERLGGHVVHGPVQFHRQLDVDALLEHLDDIEAVVNFIVIDTVHRCFIGGDEDKAQDVGMWIAGVDRVRRYTGADVLAVHHAGWGRVHERGSTALGAATDTIMHLKRDQMDNLVLECDKQKDAEEFEPIRFRLVPYEGSCVLEPINLPPPLQKTWEALIRLGGKATRGQWIAAADVSQATWYRHVERLRKEGRISDENGDYLAVP